MPFSEATADPHAWRSSGERAPPGRTRSHRETNRESIEEKLPNGQSRQDLNGRAFQLPTGTYSVNACISNLHIRILLRATAAKRSVFSHRGSFSTSWITPCVLRHSSCIQAGLLQIDGASLPFRCHRDGRSGALQGLRGHSVNFELLSPITALRAASDAVFAGLRRFCSAKSRKATGGPLKAETRVRIPLME